MPNARPREVLNAVHTVKDKGPPIADGILSVTADASDAAELASRRSALDYVATTSTYLEEDNNGPKPSDLYGKVTWRIERFSETTKRELRSNVFEIGQYKWYILVYPHGCDVCNYLSLFLCVADYDRLLPGWSHFAQFTIAVVNKDPKKSKYSDTLHRFCKKEHDWGWKKFMELAKVLDGFAVNDTLVIKAQVQIIKDCVDRPLCCLDTRYRQELVRVYLSNVEGVCRRFIDQKREGLRQLNNNAEAYHAFWRSLSRERKKAISAEAEATILKGLVKRFFNEREVTSTLVMDAIYCGCKQLEETSRQCLEGNRARGDVPDVFIKHKSGIVTLGNDALSVIESAAVENTGSSGKQEKDGETATNRNSQCDESIKDSIVRDEQRLAELGKKTVEMYVISHIFNEHIEIACQEAECLKRQEELLREEEEAMQKEQLRKKAKARNEKEKKAKRQEKKKVKQEEERKKKEAVEAERVRKEQDRKNEAERKRKEQLEQKRLQKEKKEREYQQALEESRLRQAEEQRLDAEKKKDQETMSSTQTVHERATTSNESGTEATLSEPKPSSASTTSRVNAAPSSHLGQEHNAARQQTKSGDNSAVIEADMRKQTAEFKKLQENVRALESQLKNRDNKIEQLQQQVERLTKREKELEAELAKRPVAIQTVVKASPSTGSDSPCLSQSESDTLKTATTRKVSKSVFDPSATSRALQQETKSNITMRASASGRSTRTDTSGASPLEPCRNEGRSLSSGDDASSDATFVEHSRCLFQTVVSMDPSQTSDSATHETRSISSFGTPLDPTGHEFELMSTQDVQRSNAGCEYVAPYGLESQRSLHTIPAVHGHSHSVALHQPCSVSVHGAFQASQQHGVLRANSIASCHHSGQHNLTQIAASYPTLGNISGRSYSLDASNGMTQGGVYAACTSYQDIASVMQESFGLLPNAVQQGMPPAEFFVPGIPTQQPDLHKVYDSNHSNECTAFDDFAHFSMIKDLLE